MFIAAALLLLQAGPLLAQGNIGIKNTEALNKVGDLSGTKSAGNIAQIVGTGVNAILTLVGMIFLVLMVYAGIMWMTARGEEDKIKDAQKTIIAALIGLFITVSAYAITVFVTARYE